MNCTPYPFRDFVRVKDAVRTALCEQEETYLLVTGETGTGKTALLRELRAHLDRARYRVLYFAEARRLSAFGLVRVVARTLRVRVTPIHSESLDQLVRALAEETQKVLLWFDEAHELPEETLAEARALAECDLDGHASVQILLVGMPRLRSELQAYPQLWRRIVVREEITGLQIDELESFLEHHFGPAQAKRLGEQALATLFEHAKGAPGLVLPMARRIFAAAPGNGHVEPEHVADILHRFELA